MQYLITEFLQVLLYLSQWLAKAFRLSATPALLRSDRNIVSSRMMLPISNFDLNSKVFTNECFTITKCMYIHVCTSITI